MGPSRALKRPLARSIARVLMAASTAVPYGPLPTPNRFVSSAASNGYALGVNSGTGGSKDAPWLTLDYAIANSVSGDVIQINGRPEAPLTYRAATFYSAANKSLTIQAEWRHGVILEAADSQTRIINVSIGAAGPSRDLTLYGLILHGRGNTQRALSIGTATPALGAFANVALYDCQILDITLRAIHSSALKSTNLTIRRLHLETACANPLIDIDEGQEGAIDIDDVTVDCTATAATAYVISARQAAGGGGLTFRATRVRGSLVNTAGSATTHGIEARNITGAIIEHNNVSISGATSGWVYRVFCNLGTENANNAVIRYNRGHNGHAGGHVILVGSETSNVGDNLQNDATVYGNTVTADAAATATHGIMLGFGTGGLVENNSIRAPLATLAKNQTGGTFSGNTISECSSEAMRSKGSTGTRWENNTVTLSAGYAGDCVVVDANSDTTTDSSDIEIVGNVFNIAAAPNRVIEVAVDSDAIFEDNTYNITTTLGADAFENQAATGDYAWWKANFEPSAMP